MKQLLTALCLVGMAAPGLIAETFTAGGSTYTYTEKTTQRLNSGVVHHRLRFTSPKTLNVQIVEVDLSDPNVRVETSLGSDKLFSAQTLVNRYNALKSAGRKPLVVQNASFWAMSSQANVIDDGKYAANSCLGGLVQNGKMMYETNSALNTWVGMRHSVVGFKSDCTGFAGQYKTNIRLMCPAKWGSNENTNILQPTEVNRYCHYGTIAVFNQAFPSDRAIKLINSTSGQPGTEMTSSDARYVFLNLKSGASEAYNEWVDYTVEAISDNCCSATRGSYDLVIVFALGQHAAVNALAVGDEMKMKYMWHPQSQTDVASMTPIPGLENLVAGESQPLVNGEVQTPSDYGATTYSRSAYGISQDEKKLIMCVIDKSTDATYGTSSGCNTTVMSYIMQHWGAHNIVNCDAGGSAQMVINGAQVGTPSDSRGIVSSIVVYDMGETSTGGDVEQGDSGDDTPTGGVAAVTPATGQANPFAYEVSGQYVDGQLTVNYTLNAPAKSVTLNVSGEGNSGAEYALSGLSQGTHTQTVDVAALAAGDYSWSVIVEGNPVDAPIQFASVGFNHPQGVDIVRNTDDPYYGTLIISEGRPTTSSSHWSGTRGGQGIYLFTPQMEGIPVPGADTYAFRGGLSDTNYTTSVGSAAKSGNVPRKIKISDDGRIFVSTQSSFAAPLYELPSVKDLVEGNAAFTQVMGGPIWTDTESENYYCWTTADGKFSSAPNVGLAVKGSGANLTIALLGGKNAMWTSSTTSATACNTYNLGSAKVWGGVEPSSTVAGLNGKYLVNYTGANLAYDNRGNLWFSQYRGTPSATQPSIVVVDADGNELLKDISTVLGGGGLAFNNDFTQVMHSSSTTTFSVYDLTWGADGKPVRTEKYRITHGMGTNVNDYAWDLAGNLYACGNTKELLKGFAMPRTDNSVETPARAIYNFTVEAPDAPEQEDPVVPDQPEDPSTPITRNPGETYLTLQWEVASDLAVTDARFAAANPVTGEIYVTDKAASKIYAFTQAGKEEKYDVSGKISGIGTAISCDEAGNVLVNIGFPGVNSGVNWAMIPADEGVAGVKTLTLNYGSNGRTDASGRALGDANSAEGALLTIAPNALKSAVVAKIVSGEVASCGLTTSYATANGTVTYAVAQSPTMASQMELENWANAVDIYTHNAPIQTFDNTTGQFKSVARHGDMNSYGFDLSVMGGRKYILQGYGAASNYVDSFVIYDSEGTEYHTYDGSGGTLASANYITYNMWPREDGRTVDIYGYVAGKCARHLTLSLDPNCLYIDGNATSQSRSASTAIAQTEKNGAVYSFKKVSIQDSGDGYGYITFLTEPDGTGNRYGAAVSTLLESAVTNGIDLFAGDAASSVEPYAIAPGDYDLMVDLANGSVTATRLTSGVDDVTVDRTDAPVEYFNLQGQRVKEPVKGQVVIRRQGNKAFKMIWK